MGGTEVDFIEVAIKDFSSYIKRGDIKAPTWFAVEHNLMLHPDFFKVNGDEVKAFLWIIGTAAHINKAKIRVYVEMCASQIVIPVESVRSCIEKLNGKRWSVTDPSRSCTGNSGPASPTEQDTTRHYSTEHDTTEQDTTGDITTEQNSEGIIQGAKAPPELPRLINIWNEHRGDLPAIKRLTTIRAKKIKDIWPKLTEPEWIEAVKMVAKSDFLNGRTDRGDWCASFDWFISESKNDRTPNYIKVIEGNFSKRPKKRSPAQRPPELDTLPKEAKDVRKALGGISALEALKREKQQKAMEAK